MRTETPVAETFTPRDFSLHVVRIRYRQCSTIGIEYGVRRRKVEEGRLCAAEPRLRRAMKGGAVRHRGGTRPDGGTTEKNNDGTYDSFVEFIESEIEVATARTA